MNIKAGIVVGLGIAKQLNMVVKCMEPLKPCLLEPVNGFPQLPDPTRLDRYTFRRMKIDLLMEITVEVCHDGIKLMDFEIMCCSICETCKEGIMPKGSG